MSVFAEMLITRKIASHEMAILAANELLLSIVFVVELQKVAELNIL
jgi:hypothetical protein